MLDVPYISYLVAILFQLFLKISYINGWMNVSKYNFQASFLFWVVSIELRLFVFEFFYYNAVDLRIF